MRQIILTLMLCLPLYLGAQYAAAHKPGELLIQLQPEVDFRAWLEGQAVWKPVEVEAILPEWRIWRIKLSEAQRLEDALKAWQRDSRLLVVQRNHILSPRLIPNDPEFGRQWGLQNTGQNGGLAGADISATAAWDLSTGGLSPLGDTIVLCIIDDGVNPQHADLRQNLWVNSGEIPGNGLDDDGNGYVDDYLGWNIYRQNDDITDNGNGGWHGTPVTGIVGAEGNNGLGVSGINWTSKLMIVVGGGDEAQAIQAYRYPLVMRQRYNQSNGQEGAFVVVTNASWGTDNLLSSDAPLWCAFYDSLGLAGILSVASTTNSNTNVDVQGDMPTHCNSPFLISVTNGNRLDQKPAAAGYGTLSIELAAPGAESFTTANGGGYNLFGGTSAAAPHVSGAVGLLYAAACPRFNLMAKLVPAQAALQARQYILQGVDQVAAFQGITATGGRLNLHNALLNLLADSCSLSGCYEPLRLEQRPASALGDELRLSWFAVPQAQGYILRYRHQDSVLWQNLNTSDTSLLITGLLACSDYEVQVQSDCDTVFSPYSPSYWFRTANCCQAPRQVQTRATDSSFWFSWQALSSNVDSLVLDYRLEGTSHWTSLRLAAQDSIQLSGLAPCTVYEWRWASRCSININNDQTRTQSSRTLGCGDCQDLSYCEQKGNDDSYEWISQVRIEGENSSLLQHQSGSSGGYEGLIDSIWLDLRAGQSYALNLQLGSSSNSTARWTVWIDFNRNGLFEAAELVYASDQSLAQVQDSIRLPLIPLSAGQTRLRVAARYGVSPAGLCNGFNYGEVEDYCVHLQEQLIATTPSPTSLSQARLYPNPSAGAIQVELPPNADKGQWICYNAWGQSLQTGTFEGQERLSLDFSALSPGVYFLALDFPGLGRQTLTWVKQD